MHTCSACPQTIDLERFELLYENKGVKHPVCQECASKGISQPQLLHGVFHCNENGECEGLSILTPYQWDLHKSAFGKGSDSEMEQSIKEASALEGLVFADDA